MRVDRGHTPLRKISGARAAFLRALQGIASHYVPRGLPRLVWTGRRLLFGVGQCVVCYKRRFQVICASDSYESIMTVSGILHRAMDKLLSELLAETRGNVLFLDVGANVGFVSLLACSAGGSTCRVQGVCFEPDPRAYQVLEENAALNEHNLQLVNQAVGAVVSLATLHLATESLRSTLVEMPPGGFAFVKTVGRLQVEATTIDKYCSECDLVPAIIKIDVEGFEPNVLRGAEHTIRQCRPFLIFEINPAALASNNSSLETLLNHMQDMDYRMFHVDYKQAGLSSGQIKSRHKWRQYYQVQQGDDVAGRFFDVVAIPASKFAELVRGV